MFCYAVLCYVMLCSATAHTEHHAVPQWHMTDEEQVEQAQQQSAAEAELRSQQKSSLELMPVQSSPHRNVTGSSRYDAVSGAAAVDQTAAQESAKLLFWSQLQFSKVGGQGELTLLTATSWLMMTSGRPSGQSLSLNKR